MVIPKASISNACNVNEFIISLDRNTIDASAIASIKNKYFALSVRTPFCPYFFFFVREFIG